ncbi:MAG: serpin family protein [Candidatus Nanopusillus sp.]|nr:serpin family protein [Candidatus Nanopusillus sp.]
MRISIKIVILVVLLSGVSALFYGFFHLSTKMADNAGWTPEGLSQIVNSSNNLGLKLFELIQQNNPNNNIIISPYGVFSNLLLLYNGAGGETYEELKNVLNLSEPNYADPNFGELYDILMNTSGNYELYIANGLFLNKNYEFKPSFINIANNYFLTETKNIDVTNSFGSAEMINNFISQNTNGLINNIISPSDINENTLLVIVNAIYFYGKWAKQFNKEDTEPRNFYISPTDVIKVPTMVANDVSLKDGVFDNIQVIEIPYKGNDIAMVVILPYNPYYDLYGTIGNPCDGLEGENLCNLSDILSNLTLNNLYYYLNNLNEIVVNELYMPKFSFSDEFNLIPYLESLGINTIFNPGYSNLSNIVYSKGSNENLYVSLFKQAAYIENNEEGTKAAAATVTEVQATAALNPNPIRSIIIKINRPFIFMIIDLRTKEILFIGQVINPLS